MPYLLQPSVLHLMDFAIQILVFIALTSYLSEHGSIFSNYYASLIDYRVYCIVVYSAARCLTSSPLASSRSPFLVTFVAFVWRMLDTSPSTYSYCLMLLTLALFQHALFLLLPQPPSLLLLTPHSALFPLSSMLLHLLTDVVGPIILFFIPIFFALVVVLAMAFEIPFLTNDFFIPLQTGSEVMTIVIFYIICTLFVIMLIFIPYLIAITACNSSLAVAQPGVPASWNAYGPRAGLAIRQHFYLALRYYSSPYFFPAPLNLVPIFFIALPCVGLRLIRQRRAAQRLEDIVKPILWNVLVLPFALLFGVVWGWRRS
jgi:hypothetical protein